MMSSVSSLQVPVTLEQLPSDLSQYDGKKSSLWGRVSLNKVILALNTTVIVAMIGFLHLMKFPMHAVALSLWGVCYVLLANLAQKTRPVSGDAKKLARELQAAQKALAIAENECKEFKTENQALKTQNTDLKSENRRLAANKKTRQRQRSVLRKLERAKVR